VGNTAGQGKLDEERAGARIDNRATGAAEQERGNFGYSALFPSLQVREYLGIMGNASTTMYPPM
jgi:hypothetical protein